MENKKPWMDYKGYLEWWSIRNGIIAMGEDKFKAMIQTTLDEVYNEEMKSEIKKEVAAYVYKPKTNTWEKI